MDNFEVLIAKVPEFLNENTEINAVFDAIEPEIELLKTRTTQLTKNIFPATADSDGLGQYEEWLKIPNDRTLNLSQRRGQVLAKLNETLPFTEIRLQRLLAGIVGWEHFKYERDGAFVLVTLDQTTIDSFDTVFELLVRILPLDLHFEVKLLYSEEPMKLLIGDGAIVTEIIETNIE